MHAAVIGYLVRMGLFKRALVLGALVAVAVLAGGTAAQAGVLAFDRPSQTQV